MSIGAIEWARKLTLPPRDKFVLIALCDHYNRDEKAAWMKQGTLAAWTCYTRATVNTALHALEHKHGLIVSQERRYADGRNASKVYRLNLSVNPVDPAPNSVNAVDTDRVNPVDTDRVNAVDNKNREHRSVNKEPLKTALPAVRLERRTLVRQEHEPDHQAFVDVYNECRGELAEVQKLSNKRRKLVQRLIDDLGPDEALRDLRDATIEVSSDSFWIERNLNFDNLLVDGRVTEKAEKHRAGKSQYSPADRKLAASYHDIASAIGGN